MCDADGITGWFLFLWTLGTMTVTLYGGVGIADYHAERQTYGTHRWAAFRMALGWPVRWWNDLPLSIRNRNERSWWGNE